MVGKGDFVDDAAAEGDQDVVDLLKDYLPSHGAEHISSSHQVSFREVPVLLFYPCLLA